MEKMVPIPRKTTLQLATSDVFSTEFTKNRGRSTKSSGASALVNAVLNLKAARHRMRNVTEDVMPGTRGKLHLDRRQAESR